MLRYQTFSKETLNDGLQFLEKLKPPYVLKADGLAAGKGVVVCKTPDEAKRAAIKATPLATAHSATIRAPGSSAR